MAISDLDVVFGDKSQHEIPLYIGATGHKMLQLAAEICDGVVLNDVVSVDYIQRAIEQVRIGAKRAGGNTLRSISRN